MAYYRRPSGKKAARSGVAFIYLITSAVVMLSLVNVLGAFGEVIKNIALGIFGASAYAVCLIVIIASVMKLINQRLVIDRKKALKFLPLIILGIATLHIVTTKNYIVTGYGDYLKQCYINEPVNAGGVLFGALLYPFINGLGPSFSLALFVIAFFTTAFISFYPLFLLSGNFKTKSVKYPRQKSEIPPEESDIQVGNELFIGTPDGKPSNNRIMKKSAFSSNKTRDFDIMFPNKIDADSETVNNPLIDKIKNKGSYDILFTNPFEEEKEPVKFNAQGVSKTLIFPTVTNDEPVIDSKPKPVIQAEDKYANYTLGYRKAQIKKSLEDGVEIITTSKRLGIFDDAPNDPADKLTKDEKERFEKAKKRLYGEEDEEKDTTFESLYLNKNKNSTLFDYLNDDRKQSSYDILYGNKTEPYNFPDESLEKSLFNTDIKDNETDNNTVVEQSETEISDEELFKVLPKEASSRALRSDIGKSHNVLPKKPDKSFMDRKVDLKQVSLTDSPTAVGKRSQYFPPNEDLLRMYPRIESDSIDEHQERCIALRNVLLEYDIDTVVDRYTVGPSFTRYEITMPIGVTVKRIQQISDDIAMRLKANKLRIEAPIPGKNAVGFEIPNSRPSIVGLRDCVRSSVFKKESELSFLLGMSLSGEVYACNIVKMPHLLIAGSTGSGKSVMINSLICSLLFKYSPDQLRLILIDPKRVELSLYNNLPHLLIPEVIYDAEKAINALNFLIKEMERRYELFHNMRVRNLEEHNRKAEEEGSALLPYIVLIIDELSDLMSYKKRDMEEKIKRLTQLSRAAGIHLIVATQRPSVDVITGTIKTNFPSRIAFAVTSYEDSRTILGHGGADKLQGQGDMLYHPTGAPDPIRLQGAFIDKDEVEAITNYIRANNPSFYDESIDAEINSVKPLKSEDYIDDESGDSADDIFVPALRLIIETGQASISMIQRKFAVGYARAARLIDEMEERGFIGASDGSKPREVKITMQEFHNLYGEDK
ncbi:MAG: DNA translocase FtsK [Christensenellales bacterium]